MAHSDVTLLGGGVIGLLTARELATAGASVTVIDQGLAGRESSWAGGGILLPLYPWRQDAAISTLVKHSLPLYPQLSAELKADTGIDPEWRQCGLLMTRITDSENAVHWCDTLPVRHFPADANLLEGLQTAPLNPLWLPEIAQIRNPRLLKALKQDVVNKGVTLIENCQVTAIHEKAGNIQSMTTSQGDFSSGEWVITAGSWSAFILSRFFPALAQPAISAVRGQMLLFAAKPESLDKIVLDDEHYLIPRLDGHILAGSTVETTPSFDKSITEGAKEELVQFAHGLMPALKQFPIVNHWAGLRPGSPGGVPFIGRHPEIANLSINAGHFRNGLAMGPASARLLADMLLQRNNPIDAAPYRLNRTP